MATPPFLSALIPVPFPEDDQQRKFAVNGADQAARMQGPVDGPFVWTKPLILLLLQSPEVVFTAVSERLLLRPSAIAKKA